MNKNILAFSILFTLFSIPQILDAKDYWAAELCSRQSYLYGKYEVRMKSSGISGLTSTFFTYNINSGTYNEIDIEIMGKETYQVQYNSYIPDQSGNPKVVTVKFNPHSAFHVYAIEWTPYYVSWSVDGSEIYRQNDARIAGLNLPQAIMMSIWPPQWADWAGTLDTKALPAFAMYDWVKYYKYTPGVNNNFTLNWTDEFNTLNSDKWKISNGTFGSNLADFKPGNALIKNGYLILCLTKNGVAGSFAGDVPDTDIDAPYVASGFIGDKYISLKFSETVEKISAETLSNYTVPGLTLEKAELQPDGTTVHVSVSGAAWGIIYNLLVRNIKDTSSAGNAMTLKVVKVAKLHSLPSGINIGGAAVDSSFLADQKWDSSTEYGTIGGSTKTVTAAISGAQNPEIYKTAVEGISFVKQRLPNGVYKVKLMLAEAENNAPGLRVFDVYCNGRKMLENIDIFKEAGQNTALEKTIDGVNVDNECLDIYFSASKGKTVLYGTEIVSASATGVEIHGSSVPKDYTLDCFPNPFNPATNIKFSLSKSGLVILKVFNLLGQEVATLVRGHFQGGEHTVTLNAGNWTSGVYICRMESANAKISRKLVLLK